MIVGNYKAVKISSNKAFEEALEWLRGESWKSLPAGRYNISGDAYAMVQEYTSKRISDGRFENHHDYADIQMVISGKEMMYATQNPSVAGEGAGYQSDNDIEFFGGYDERASSVFMEPGLVCVLFPEDYHMPCIEAEGLESIRKLVIKVRVSR